MQTKIAPKDRLLGQLCVMKMLLAHSLFLLPLPTAGSSAGQNQTVGGYRKADLFGLYFSAKSGYNGSMNHVGKHCRLQACGIRIHQEKQRIIG